MPAKKTAAVKTNEPKTVSWNIHELPSAQHKCGLAGLAMMIPNWERTKNKKGTLRIEELSSDVLTITVDRDGMTSLFDHMFAMDPTERVVWDSKKSQKLEDKLGFKVLGRVEGGTRVVVDVPRYPLLSEWEEPTKDGSRLWKNNSVAFFQMRAMPMAIKSRFKSRYTLNTHLLEKKEGEKVKDDPFDMLMSDKLVEFVNTWALTGTKKTLEGVSVFDKEHDAFTLRFWEQILPIYQVPAYDVDGSIVFKNVQSVVAVPEVTDLAGFCRNWPLVMKARTSEPHYVKGSWPASSVLQHPAEAGLSILNIMGKFSHKNSIVHRNIAGTHVYAMLKVGKVTRISSSMWVEPTEDMQNAYAAVLSQRIHSRVWHRRQIENVLLQQPWWYGADVLAATTPLSEWGLASKDDKNDKKPAPYLLWGIQQSYQKELMKMSTTKSLEEIVLHRIRHYVFERADKRSGAKASEHARDAEREKIASEVFLALRSRAKSPNAFVRYWAETICSVQAFGGSGFNELAEFFANPKSPTGVKVRNLSFLALSSLKASTKKKPDDVQEAPAVDDSKDSSVVADDDDLEISA